MREIKFRAWIDFNDEFVYLNELGDFDGNYESFSWEYVQALETMEQYTGLKDKNGVEIYENMEIDNIYKVGFDNAAYILTNISKGDIVLLSKYFGDKNGQIEITKEYTQV